MRKRAFLSCLVLIGLIICGLKVASGQSLSPPAQIDVRADKDKISIADIINYKVTITLAEGAQIKLAQTGDRLGELYIKDFKQQESKDKDNRRVLILDYKLTAYKAGKLTLPAYSIQYRRQKEENWETLNSRPLEISVESLIGEDQDAQLKLLKPKFGIWQNYLLLFFLGLVFVIAVILLVMFWRRRKKAGSLMIPSLPAHVIAYEELENLRKMDLPAKGSMKEYFEKLSGCIRRYLENRFDLRAPWMSTEEFLEKAKTSQGLNNEQKKILKNFLLLSDLVKFARYGSSPNEAEDSYIAAKGFVDQTKQESRLNEGKPSA